MRVRFGWVFSFLVTAVSFVAVASCVGDDPTFFPGGTNDGSAGDGTSNDGASGDGSAVPGPVVTDIYRGGSRLEPNWVSLATGERHFVDWWDTTLKTHCRFERLADGKYRCVPIADQAFTGEAFFANSTCTAPQAYWMQEGCSQTPAYIRESDCPPKVYRTGEKVTSAWEPVPAPCHVAQTTGLFFERKEEVPPESWAEGTLEDWDEAPDGGTPLPVKAQFIRGADGSYGFHEWSLRSVSTTCAFTTNGEGETLRCFPRTTAFASSEYVDDTCTHPVLTGVGATCANEEQKFAVRYENDGDTCYPKMIAKHWFLVGAPYTGIPYYKADGGCVQSSGSGLQGHASGQEVDVASFGQLTVKIPPGVVPLESIYGVLPDGTRTRLAFYDTKHATPCVFTPYRAADGKARCLPPTSGELRKVFSDAACTKPLDLVRVAHPSVDQPTVCQPPNNPACDAGTSCAAPPKPAFTSILSGRCLADLEMTIYRAGTARSTFYEKSGNACVVRTARQGEAFYDATEVPPSELLEGSVSYP